MPIAGCIFIMLLSVYLFLYASVCYFLVLIFILHQPLACKHLKRTHPSGWIEALLPPQHAVLLERNLCLRSEAWRYSETSSHTGMDVQKKLWMNEDGIQRSAAEIWAFPMGSSALTCSFSASHIRFWRSWIFDLRLQETLEKNQESSSLLFKACLRRWFHSTICSLGRLDVGFQMLHERKCFLCFLPVSKGKLQQEKEKLEKRFCDVDASSRTVFLAVEAFLRKLPTLLYFELVERAPCLWSSDSPFAFWISSACAMSFEGGWVAT